MHTSVYTYISYTRILPGDRTGQRLDSLRGSSVNIGTIRRILAWPPRKDDMHTSRSVNNMYATVTLCAKPVKGLLSVGAQPKAVGVNCSIPRFAPGFTPRLIPPRVV